MPPHDLEPPKFSRIALERILSDFEAVKQIILFNHVNSYDLDPTVSSASYFGAAFDEDSGYVDSQSGSIDLDKFVYFLVVKAPNELLVLLVDTIKKKLTGGDDETEVDLEVGALAVKRLVRSVARLFSVLCMETFPSNLHIDLSHSSGKIKSNGNKRGSQPTPVNSNSSRVTIGICFCFFSKYFKNLKIN